MVIDKVVSMRMTFEEYRNLELLAMEVHSMGAIDAPSVS
jgi:hypothetical protein